MTIDECKKYLPNRWAEIIQQDPLLMEIFEEHDYDLEEEAVPPFLFQELRGGNIEHLRPIFALYGQTGLNMLQELLEIDEISKDTAKVELPDEQTSYCTISTAIIYCPIISSGLCMIRNGKILSVLILNFGRWG